MINRNQAFETCYELDFDFDGTMADSFVPSPNGVGVEENYEDTLGQIFGDQILNTYLEKGGLMNRSPAEVVGDLHELHPEVIDLARAHYEQNTDELRGVMLGTLAILDSWEAAPLTAATEVYIRQDLISSLDHIGLLNADGLPWPRPCNGFESFWKTLQELNEADLGFEIDTSVISSGYVEYITKTFGVWGLPLPDIWVTDDNTRGRKYPAEMKDRVKPAPFGMALARHQWLRRHGQIGENFDIEVAKTSKDRVFYFGDDPRKDGQLAARARVGFGHFDPAVPMLEFNGEYSRFGDWQDIEERLVDSVDLLAKGVSLGEIIHMSRTRVA